MKKSVIAASLVVVVLGVFFLQGQVRQKVFRDFTSTEKSEIYPSPTTYEKVTPIGEETASEFVPYWTMSNGIDSDLDGLIYFGVSPGIDGINTEEEGYRLLPRFLDLAGERKKYLTIRMLDQDTSTQILESKKIQEKVVEDSINLAEENNFDGIVVDLEYKALPFDSVIKGINDFFTIFNSQAQKNDLKFSVLIYGDNFYRVRPYDMKHIAKNSDEIMIMAYDFHKAGGNPGPNFPLDGAEKYGYSFKEMIGDFLKAVPPEKLTVVFGMFGYDWKVDEKDVSLGQARSLSLIQMKSRFVNSCEFADCVLERDVPSSELFAVYKDDEGERHRVWFEDEESIKRKKDFLKERGINSTSYWAHSYFE